MGKEVNEGLVHELDPTCHHNLANILVYKECLIICHKIHL